MGRKIKREDEMNIKHLPYMNWVEWMNHLSQFKYGVHLMRTHAAGTFALNCAYLGIPCIGYEGLDTQEICHPNLIVKIGDLKTAKSLINKVWNNEEFYLSCGKESKNNYNNFFSEKTFNKKKYKF